MNIKANVNAALRRLALLGVPRVRPRIIRSLAHDSEAFCQGLLCSHGELFESTGTWQRSSLRRLCKGTGSVLQSIKVEEDFAEGIAVLGDHLYQATLSGKHFRVYDVASLEVVEPVTQPGPIWGLGTYDQKLYCSDGSSVLRLVQHDGIESRRIRVSASVVPLRHLNALTTCGGNAIINIWYSSQLACVELATGKLKQVIDCKELVDIENPRTRHHVLNGIAFDETSGRFFVTGKCWRTMHEIEIPGVQS